jgi:hypothetical protein
MTEDEANDVRCCGPSGCGRTQIHVETPDLAPNDAEYWVTRKWYCIGSACMAWRWSARMVARHKETGVIRDLNLGDHYSTYDEVALEVQSDQGFCGLATIP